MKQTPTIGRIVQYTLNGEDAELVNRRRTTGEEIHGMILERRWSVGAQAHIGSPTTAGQTFPALIVATKPEGPINLQVFLDGCDVLWVVGVEQAEEPKETHWNWPPVVYAPDPIPEPEPAAEAPAKKGGK
jgi:hypothetical protein